MKRVALVLAFAGVASAAQLERPGAERSGRLRSDLPTALAAEQDSDLAAAAAAPAPAQLSSGELPALAAEQDRELAAAAPAPGSSPAPGPAGGIPKEVWMGYHRLFAHDYFERFGHWSTGGPQPMAAAEGPAAAPGPAMAPAAADE